MTRLEPAAEALASAYPPLLLAAHRVAATLMQGLHGRRRAGPGEDFWQFRPYTPGDATSRIDWRKSARSGDVLIREREWAAASTVWIWTASGPGMAWKSKLSPVTKSARADLIAMALAVLAAEAGERAGLMGAPFSPGHSRLALSRIASALEAPREVQALPPAIGLPRHSSLLLIGDFLEPIAAIRERFTLLAERVAHGHLVEIADPAEETLPWSGRVNFRDVSSQTHRTFGQVERLRGSYVERLALHRARLKDLTRKLGWSHVIHRTDESPARLLLTLHERMGRQAGAA